MFRSHADQGSRHPRRGCPAATSGRVVRRFRGKTCARPGQSRSPTSAVLVIRRRGDTQPYPAAPVGHRALMAGATPHGRTHERQTRRQRRAPVAWLARVHNFLSTGDQGRMGASRISSPAWGLKVKAYPNLPSSTHNEMTKPAGERILSMFSLRWSV